MSCSGESEEDAFSWGESSSSVETPIPSRCAPTLDLKAIETDLLRMGLEIERAIENQHFLLIKRGSVRGRHMLVYNTLRRMKQLDRWKLDYERADLGRVTVYTTSCGIVGDVRRRCAEAIGLLSALRIAVRIKDLYIDSSLIHELSDRLQLNTSDRDFIYSILPLVYVNGRYFGNEATLREKNDSGELSVLLDQFQGESCCCPLCGGAGYMLCPVCRGGKHSSSSPSSISPRGQLRCAACDLNGIVACPHCNRRTSTSVPEIHGRPENASITRDNRIIN